MTVVINGNTGISGTNGSAGTPAVQGEDTNTGIFFPAADTVAVATAGSERLRVDSSGNVGIGTTSPSTYGKLVAVSPDNTSSTQVITAISNNLGQSVSMTFAGLRANSGAGLGFAVNGSTTNAASIDIGRNFLMGATSTAGFATQTSNSAQLYLMGLTYHRNEVNTSGRFWYSGPEGSSAGTYLLYNANNTGVYLGYGSTSWAANSDERMKTTLVPFEDAVGKVCSLRAGTGRYLTDEEDVSRSFLIAQDVQAVLPEAVDVKEDEQGTLGLRYSDVVPLLVAAIKELKAEVDSLKAQLEAK